MEEQRDRTPQGDVAEAVREALDKVLRGGRVEGVFGEPRMLGDKMVIPVAVVSYRGGGGAGQGPAPAQVGRPRGFGFGGAVTARPVAVIEVTGQETRVVPVVDVADLALKGMLIGLAMFTLGRIFRRR